VNDMRSLRMLARYSAWANERLFLLLSTLSNEVVTAKHPSSFGSIAGTLSHAYVVDLIWQAHLQGREHGFTARNTECEPPIGSLMTNQTALDSWYVDYADALSGTAHDDIVQFTFVDGGVGSMSRGEILLHVVNHKTYHRGNVANLLHHAGVRVPVMDLPVFLRDALDRH
jgi:uncharacterized damage-inducible protein DinB